MVLHWVILQQGEVGQVPLQEIRHVGEVPRGRGGAVLDAAAAAAANAAQVCCCHPDKGGTADLWVWKIMFFLHGATILFFCNTTMIWIDL